MDEPLSIVLKKPAVFAEETPPEPSPDGIECPICQNRGYISWIDEDGTLRSRECECMAQRRSVRHLRRSGLQDMVEAYSFKTFRCPDEWAKKVKAAALDYVKDGAAPWWYISGRPGCGKTHICTAICSRLMQRGEEVRYMLWREEVPVLKALVNEPEEYERRMNALARVPVLYIDDFFKGTVSDADINLAFALLNARYNKTVRTLLSSELPIAEVRRHDEATASRIIQRARGYILNAPPGVKNWREA